MGAVFAYFRPRDITSLHRAILWVITRPYEGVLEIKTKTIPKTGNLARIHSALPLKLLCVALVALGLASSGSAQTNANNRHRARDERIALPKSVGRLPSIARRKGNMDVALVSARELMAGYPALDAASGPDGPGGD